MSVTDNPMKCSKIFLLKQLLHTYCIHQTCKVLIAKKKLLWPKLP